jgi:hypothetical protein
MIQIFVLGLLLCVLSVASFRCTQVPKSDSALANCYNNFRNLCITFFIIGLIIAMSQLAIMFRK